MIGLVKSMFGYLTQRLKRGSSGLVHVGTFTVRQPGGTAGTDEVQISHDGTDATFRNMDTGRLILRGDNGLLYNSAGVNRLLVSTVVRMHASQSFGWIAGTDVTAEANDLVLVRDAANTLAQRNGTAAQQSNIYFSYTDGSNYERLALKTASGSYTIEAETAGSGTDNINLRLTPAGTGTVVVLNGGGVNNLLRIGTINTRSITQFIAAGMYGWTSASGADGGDNDTNLGRAAAGVVAAYGASSATAGWIQNTAARSRVANDVTNATITPANITGLSATLIAGRKYSGRLVLFINNALAADGLRLDFDGGTATMTSFRAGFEAGANVTTFGTMNSSALATDLTIDAFSGTGDSVVVVSFSLVCNAAGTFIPRIAKEADAAGATLTVYTNSFMWLEDVP